MGGLLSIKELHVISTGKQTVSEFVQIIAKVHEYIDYVHIREQNWTANDRINAITMLHEQNVPLHKIIINDRIDIALIMNCGGVQLATHSIDVAHVKRMFNHLLTGCSVHSVSEAIEKEKAGADYLLYGHIYKTNSKPNLAPRGIDALSHIVQSVSIPVIAIGGISPDAVPHVVETGAKGVAVLSGVLLAKDPLQAVKQYRKQLEGV